MVLKLSGRLKRRQATIIALIALSAYVSLSFGPSMIRAAIMASLAIVAQSLGRQKAALWLLLLTAWGMLLYQPWWVYDTGFQLSFAATIGIILLEPIISAKTVLLPNMIAEMVSTTLAAQIVTLPIISATFGSIAIIGIIANISVIWMVPGVMMVGAIIIPLILLSVTLGGYAVWLIEPGLWYFKHIISYIANLPLAAISLQMSGIIVALYYAIVVLIIWLKERRSAASAIDSHLSY
jgi:competence protein ComEC